MSEFHCVSATEENTMPTVTVDDPWLVDSVRLLGYVSLALGLLGATLKGLYTFIVIIILIPSSRLAYHKYLINSYLLL